MVRPRLGSCIRGVFSYSRSVHTRSGLDPIPIAHLLDTGPKDARNVVIDGFVRSIRNQKKLSFASIGDGSSLEPLQALLAPAQAQSLSNGTAVRLRGAWKPSPNSKLQSHELHVEEVEIIGSSNAETYPLQKKYQSPEYLRTIPHLRGKLPFNTTLLRFRSDAILAITQLLSKEGFTQTHTPIITSSDCEGAGEVFAVTTSEKRPTSLDDDEPSTSATDDGSFFRSPKYLTVSSQLHLEALAQSVGRVWTLSPTFRAEKSHTARHLSEFYMLEAELPFVDDMDVVMGLVEKILVEIQKILQPGVSRVADELLEPLRPLGEQKLLQRWAMKPPFPRITYTEAIKLLQSSSHFSGQNLTWGVALQAEHERYIATEVGGSPGGFNPVFVTHYPKNIKPFYMLPSANCDEGQETVDCFDLLVPETCEIVGGSMREHRLEPFIAAMRSKGLILPGEGHPTDEDLGELKWYTDLRRWGSVPHGGFGIGFDRLLGYMAGVPNIRDMVTFPRWVGRCDC